MTPTPKRSAPSRAPASSGTSGPRRRRRFEVRGRVQGVGFRPFLWRLAARLDLAGELGNDAGGAFADLEGPESALEEFRRRLREELPPLARIASIRSEDLLVCGQRRLAIVESGVEGPRVAEVSPDVATCRRCRRELEDPADRRFRYAFINCTDCGPRYSIIRAVPYDRPRTTMARFAMCPECQREYEDPRTRRFHAQPNACAACGPRLRWVEGAGNGDRATQEKEDDPVRAAAGRLRAGGIVAIKGIGGFHLACRADPEGPLERLRERKARESKPLALMVPSLEAARELAEIDASARAALEDPARPIVLLPMRPGAPVHPAVAPGCDRLGVLLPYAPLQWLLFAEGLGPLVMTSGNPSEEPLSYRDEEALERLSDIADGFLLHDREIERPIDDSVVVALPERARPVASGARAETASNSPPELAAGGVVPIRRARGFVPAPLLLPLESPGPLLATGGDLKAAVCFAEGARAIASEHLGDLEHVAAYRHWLAAIERLGRLLEIEPAALATDLHPGYQSARWARARGLELFEVQHHHAHIASCLADNGRLGRVVGIACDGTGYGSDGTIWGGELLVADELEFVRGGSLRPFALPGGDAAARETWRPAAGLLEDALGEAWIDEARRISLGAPPEALEVTARRLRAPSGGGAPRTSSLGRLFDGVASLLGLVARNHHEAEAAMRLEAAARSAREPYPLGFELREGEGEGEGGGGGGGRGSGSGSGTGREPAASRLELDPRPLVRELVAARSRGEDASRLALGFHEAVADALARGATRLARREGLAAVALSGGCFVNEVLLSRLIPRLEREGLEVLAHRSVPCGDGGLALGQALIAARRWSDREPREPRKPPPSEKAKP